MLVLGDEPSHIIASLTSDGLSGEEAKEILALARRRVREEAEARNRAAHAAAAEDARMADEVEESAGRWVVVAGVCALLLCLPLGALAILAARQAHAAARDGHVDEAHHKLLFAKIMAILGIFVGAIIWYNWLLS
jgi:hypothetical protein